MGKTIFERETVVEDKSSPKPDFLERVSRSKTFRGYLNGCLKKSISDENRDMVVLFRELLTTFNEFYPNKIIKNEIEIIQGWKGVDNIEIFKGFTEDFIIKSHLKDKETGEVTTTSHQVPHEKVNKILSFIKRMKVADKVKCYDFAPYLGYKTWKDLWKERKDYFELYYYPIKVIEALGIIKYSGRGDITRLK